MYAVIETGGKQYRVELGSEIEVDRLDVEPGQTIDLERVLLVADGDQAAVGAPTVDGAVVSASVVRQTRGEKLVVFKYKPKARSRVKNGARADLTLLRIADIAWAGRSAAKEDAAAAKERDAAAAKAAKAAAEKAAADQALAAKLAAAAPAPAAAEEVAKPARRAKAAAAEPAPEIAAADADAPSQEPVDEPAAAGSATAAAADDATPEITGPAADDATADEPKKDE
jgi:large subunit ribosomal protein L21